MAKSYDVLVKVISQQGICDSGHKAGDEWVIGDKTPEGICLSAFDSIFSTIRVLKFGGSFPWESDPDVATIACPDAENPVVFEITRLRK
jgi:uncharacterized repeat protein (TIGR04076 family)